MFAILVGVKIVQYGYAYHSKENILWGIIVITFGSLSFARFIWRYRY